MAFDSSGVIQTKVFKNGFFLNIFLLYTINKDKNLPQTWGQILFSNSTIHTLIVITKLVMLVELNESTYLILNQGP